MKTSDDVVKVKAINDGFLALLSLDKNIDPWAAKLIGGLKVTGQDAECCLERQGRRRLGSDRERRQENPRAYPEACRYEATCRRKGQRPKAAGAAGRRVLAQ